MEPTIGRIVNFKIDPNSVRPALITRVWSPSCVNLTVFMDGGNDLRGSQFQTVVTPNGMQSIAVVHSFGEDECRIGIARRTSVTRGDGVGQWDWMPYQKGQAAKTEELK